MKTFTQSTKSCNAVAAVKQLAHKPTKAITNNRPEAIAQRKIQKAVHDRLAQPIVQRVAVSNQSNQPTIQRITAEEMSFLHSGKYGLRHVNTLQDAERERQTGVHGDAVILSAAGRLQKEKSIFEMTYEERKSQQNEIAKPSQQSTVDNFNTDVLGFITNCLNYSLRVDDNATLQEFLNSARGKSSFILVEGMKGADYPTDTEKKDFKNLGKGGKQDISSSQINHIMTIDSTIIDYLSFFYEDQWDSTLGDKSAHRQVVDAAYNDIATLMLDQMNDRVSFLRTKQYPDWLKEVAQDMQSMGATTFQMGRDTLPIADILSGV